MKQDNMQKTKSFLEKCIPEKLLVALNDYDNFTAQSTPTDFKAFGNYHSACKSVLSHILLLMKLLQSICYQKEEKQAEEWLLKAHKAVSEMEDFEDEN